MGLWFEIKFNSSLLNNVQSDFSAFYSLHLTIFTQKNIHPQEFTDVYLSRSSTRHFRVGSSSSRLSESYCYWLLPPAVREGNSRSHCFHTQIHRQLKKKTRNTIITKWTNNLLEKLIHNLYKYCSDLGVRGLSS